jgi:hypothetical protein
MNPEELIALLFGGSTLLFTICSVLVPLLCTGGLIFGIFWLLKRGADQARAKHQASLAWQMTTGKITKSRVEVSGGETTSVSPRIAYEYEVYGKSYQGEQIRAGGLWVSGPTRSAYDIVDAYPVGATVTVYYDPNKPEDSALER